MYLPNKYTYWYNSIINSARNRKLAGYCETHHIIPRSLGGSNDIDNLVDLTAKEHFICHLLLVKMVPANQNQKLIYAAWCMSNLQNSLQQRHKVTGRTYDWLKKKWAIYNSERTKTNNPMHDPAIKDRHSKSIKKRGPTKGTTGKKFVRSEEFKERQRQKTIASMTPERRELERQRHLNRTPEQKAIYAFAHSKRISCVYCKTTCNPGSFAKYHGSKCKHK